MGRRLNAILKTLTISLVLAVVLATGGYAWLRGSLPQSSGELALAGLDAPVTLTRDDKGLLTIRAQSEHDAYLALGFAHAQDRLWQMDFIRRTAAGRLSEIVGPSTLGHDRFMRTLGFDRLAAENVAALDEATRASLEAYSQGVNQFLETREGPWPLGILLLRYEPAAWTPKDSLLWGRLMALRLSNNWHQELVRARLEGKLPPEDIEALWPSYPENAPVTLAEDPTLTDGLPLRALAEAVPPSLRPADASNSWVLSGGRTESGHPLLANDPHLELEAPGFWYLVRIETPELTLAGATAPGVPFMILGHNGHLAWGFTTTHSDTQDIFIEKLAPGDPENYLTPDGPKPFETRVEGIGIKDYPDEPITIRRSRHGPILDEVLGERRPDWAEDRRLALAWPALRADDRTAQALYHMNHARDAASFKEALRTFDSPQQNIVYADRSGQIGFLAPARVPIRKAGDGRRPVPGWSGDYDWTGFIPFEALPFAENPGGRRLRRGQQQDRSRRLSLPYHRGLATPLSCRTHRAAPGRAYRAAALTMPTAMQLDRISLGARLLLPHSS